jgi:hypothetical protein
MASPDLERKIQEELADLEAKRLRSPIMPCMLGNPHAPHQYSFTDSQIAGQPIQVGCPGVSGFTPDPESPSEYDQLRDRLGDEGEPLELTIHKGLPSETAYIISKLLPEMAAHLIEKSDQYGPRNHRALGPAGQFGDIWRKIAPLKRALWDGIDLPGEGPREILRDLIGHALLTMEMLDHEVPREGDWDSVVS